MVSVCFVCLGNICRSPTAAGVMRHLVREAGLDSRIRVESAGEGKGTTFIVELPLTVSAAAEKAPPRELPRDEVRPHRRQTR